jgi:hypothetical protein
MVTRILESAEQIMGEIRQKKGLSEAALKEKIKAKQAEYGGLLTEAGAAYSIAKELGVELGFDTGPVGPSLRINQLTEGMRDVSLTARVESISAPRTFRKDGREGTVVDFMITDDTGTARLVLWNKDSSLTDTIEKGSMLDIKNAYTKTRDVIELHIGNAGTVAVVKAIAAVQETKTCKLEELKEGAQDVDCIVRVASIFAPHEYERDGKKRTMLSAIVTDGTSIKRLVLWEPHSGVILHEGDAIRVEDGYVKANRKGEIELHLGNKGRLVPGVETTIPSITPAFNRVFTKDISGDAKSQEIRATIVDVYVPTLLEICSSCGSVLRELMCVKCNAPTEPSYSLIVNAELDDGSGVIRGTFYRANAERLLGFTGKDFKGNRALFDERKSAVLGSEFVFTGDVRAVPQFNRLEFIVRDFRPIDVNSEINRLNR